MVRKKTGIAIEPELWKEFKKALEERGLSTCFVLETLIQAWLAGTKAPPANKVHQGGSITVIQNFQRFVKRERRLYTENIWVPVTEPEVVLDPLARFKHNFPVLTRKDEESGYDLFLNDDGRTVYRRKKIEGRGR